MGYRKTGVFQSAEQIVVLTCDVCERDMAIPTRLIEQPLAIQLPPGSAREDLLQLVGRVTTKSTSHRAQ